MRSFRVLNLGASAREMEVLAAIEECIATACIPPAHVAYLHALKARGFTPRVIYDIGAAVLHWTRIARELWPDAAIYVFDAYEPLEALYINAPHAYHIGLLGDRDGAQVKYYTNPVHFGGNSYYKEHDDRVFPPDRYVLKSMERLDTVVGRRGFPLPDLVKIDVQGAEKDILCGGMHALSRAQHLIVEMQHVQYNLGAPTVETTLPFIESLGWTCTAPLFSNNGPDGDYGFERRSPLPTAVATTQTVPQDVGATVDLKHTCGSTTSD